MQNLKETNQFPIKTLPEIFRTISESLFLSFGYPLSYTAMAIIAAVATAVGTTVKLQFKQGFEVFGNIYCYFISDPGTCKSHPISWAFRPIDRRHQSMLREYRKKYENYLLETSGKKKKNTVKEPTFKAFIVKDFTPESLLMQLCRSPKGVVAIIDELIGMFKNANRYNSSAFSEFLNEVFSNITIYKTRIGSEPLHCLIPYLTIIGTTQPSMLSEIYSNDKSKNGGMARFIPIFPKDLSIPIWSDKEHDAEIERVYSEMIDKLLDIEVKVNEEGDPMPRTIEFTAEAKEKIIDWQRHYAEKIESEDRGQTYQDAKTKLPIYLLKFSLLNQMMRMIAGESNADAVDIISVNNAITQIEYIDGEILKVHDFVYSRNILLKMTEQQRKVYALLPNSFCISDVYDLVMAKAEFTKDQLKKFVRVRDYFVRVSKGYYVKKYEDLSD
ncbi:DUF3987 domain-containing protein [Bacteroides sp.]